VKPRQAATAIRLGFIWLARWFDWRHALVLVQPATLIRWHRQGFRLFWRWKSRPRRPRIPAELQALIHQMTHENLAWGIEAITLDRSRFMRQEP
jgi:putative transposase